MTRPFAPLLLAALAACGPGADAPPAFPIELYVTAGLIDEISAFQVALVKNGSSLDCVTVQRTCIKDQVDAARFVLLKDSVGRELKARSFSLELVTGSPNTQDLSLSGLPLGKDFALVVEAVGTEATPTLRGSSCNYVKELTAGANPAVFAKIEPLSPPAACDPRL